MKTIGITGVSGYLGSRLVTLLAERQDIETIVGMDIIPPRMENTKLKFYTKDIRDNSIADVFKEHGVDTVMHLAFVVKPIHDLKKMHDVDYNGTLNILECARQAGVGHVVAVSSTFAYGAHKDNPPVLNEDDPLRGNKNFPYGYNKRVVDIMMQEYTEKHPDLPLTILRPCTVFGPTINNYVYRLVFRKVTMNFIGNNPDFQFVHEDDFVGACLAAMDKQMPGAFNVAGDGTLTIREIAKKVGAIAVPTTAWMVYPMLELAWKMRLKGIETNSGVLDYIRFPFVGNNEKAKKELDFYPRYSSVETLDETINARKAREQK
jgi:UDP-glucose 4-epimerase